MNDILKSVWKNDVGRLLAVALLGVLILIPLGTTTGWGALAFNGFSILAVVIFSHVTRRVLFPYLDLKRFAHKAMESATGAGIVVLAVCIVIASAVIAQAMLLS